MFKKFHSQHIQSGKTGEQTLPKTRIFLCSVFKHSQKQTNFLYSGQKHSRKRNRPTNTPVNNKTEILQALETNPFAACLPRLFFFLTLTFSCNRQQNVREMPKFVESCENLILILNLSNKNARSCYQMLRASVIC